MVEEKWSKKDLADLEYAKKHYGIGSKYYPVYSDDSVDNHLYRNDINPYLYESCTGIWILGSANVRNANGAWAKLEKPVNKIYELW